MTAHTGAGNKIPKSALDSVIRHVEEGKSVVVAAQLVGYTDRTIYRAAGSSPDFRQRLDAALEAARARRLCGCGTLAAYRRGCKCTACRAANNAHTRSVRDNRRALAAAS